LKKLACALIGDDAFGAFVEHDHPVGDRVNGGELVRDDDEGDAQALRQSQDQLVELGRGDRVEPGRWLVEEQDHRVERHRARDRGALLHAPADLGRHVAAKGIEPDQLQFHPRDQIHRGTVQRRVFFQRQAYVF
jgi:hypothetical protein